MTSIGLRPAVLFLSLTGVKTAASISARKLSNGTTRAIISSGSPFAVIAASRLSASKNPNCPIVPTRESCCHHSDSHKFADVAIFQGAHNIELYVWQNKAKIMSFIKRLAGGPTQDGSRLISHRLLIRLLRRGGPELYDRRRVRLAGDVPVRPVPRRRVDCDLARRKGTGAL